MIQSGSVSSAIADSIALAVRGCISQHPTNHKLQVVDFGDNRRLGSQCNRAFDCPFRKYWLRCNGRVVLAYIESAALAMDVQVRTTQLVVCLFLCHFRLELLDADRDSFCGAKLKYCSRERVVQRPC